MFGIAFITNHVLLFLPYWYALVLYFIVADTCSNELIYHDISVKLEISVDFSLPIFHMPRLLKNLTKIA